jgi:cell division protein FtsB
MRINTRRSVFKEKWMGIWIVLITIFIMELMAYAWCRVQCTRIGYNIAAQSAYQRSLLQTQSRLKAELARLKSPNRISRIAREKIGLSRPRQDQLIVYR